MASTAVCAAPSEGRGLPPRKAPPARAVTAPRRQHLATEPSSGAAGQRESSPPVSRGGPAREKRLSDAPAKYRGMYRKAWEGKSRKAAIRAFCLECVGWSEHEVRLCTAPACPLFEFREQG